MLFMTYYEHAFTRIGPINGKTNVVLITHEKKSTIIPVCTQMSITINIKLPSEVYEVRVMGKVALRF